MILLDKTYEHILKEQHNKRYELFYTSHDLLVLVFGPQLQVDGD